MFELKAKETLAETARLQKQIELKRHQLADVSQQLEQKSEEMKIVIGIATSDI